MNVSGERILIFGDSLSHHGDDNAIEIWPVDQDSNRSTSAPGDLLASLLLEQGAQAVMVDANVGRSAINFWSGGAKHQFNTSDDLIATDQQFAPTKVIVFLGTNDLGMDTTSDATGFTMIKNAFPNAQVIAIGPPIFADDKLNAQAEIVYGTLRDVFGSNNVIDARSLSSTDGRASDGIHFGASAAAEFAYQLVAAVKTTGGLPLWQMLGLGVIGIGLFVAAGSWWHKREARSAQMHGLGEPEPEPEEHDEPESDHDEPEETEAERAEETRAAVRWYAKKYGITPLEARKLVTSDKAEDINHEIELWRVNHGFPAPNSALVRGMVQEKIRGLGWGFNSPKHDEEMAEKSLHEEEQAIEDYGERASEADDPELQHIFEHNRAEEETHAEHLRTWGAKHGGLTGETPIAMVRFRSLEARREFQDKLRERMYAAGYEQHQITDYIRENFPGATSLVAHISGSDDIDRAADVANEVRGVMVKRNAGLSGPLPPEVMKKWASKRRAYLKALKTLSEGSGDIEPARRARDNLRKVIDEAAGHAPGSYNDPLVQALTAEQDALPGISEASEQGRAARVAGYAAESKRLREEEREARAHLPSDYQKLSGLEAARRQPEYETQTSEDGPGMRPPWAADVGIGRRNNASHLYWKRVVAEYKKEAALREQGSDAALRVDLKVGHAPDGHTPYTYVDWPDPMDTKGAIAFAKKLIDDGGAMYSDVRARVFRPTSKRDAGDRGVVYTLAKFEDEHA